MILAKDRVQRTFFSASKEKKNSQSALEEILQKANKLEAESGRSLGDDGLKNVVDITKETAKEQPLLDDATTFGLQMESLGERMKKLLNILSLYLGTLKSKETQDAHNLISFILVKSIGVLNEKTVEFADYSRKKFQQRLQEKKSNDEEEASTLREFTDWLVKVNCFFEEKLKVAKTGEHSQDFRSDIDFNLAQDKINIFLQYHKRTQLIKENNRLVKNLNCLTEEMSTQKQAATVAAERATLSDMLSEDMREHIHKAIMKREIESRNIMANK